MSIQKLFESVDKEVFTPELQSMLKEAFDQAVDEEAHAKAIIIADRLTESKISELEELAEKYGDYVAEQADNYGDYILEESKNQLNETLERLSNYVDLVIAEFLDEARESLVESVKSEQADMLIEAFDSLLISSGLELAEILESKNVNESRYSDMSKERVNILAEEVIQLKEENEKLIKLGIISELSEGLTLMQSDRFKRLAEIVPFERSESYINKLETIKESVCLEVNESVKDNFNTSNRQTSKSAASYAHLI